MNISLLKALSIFSFVLISLNLSSQIKIVEINASALVDDKSKGEYAILIYSDGQLKDSIYCKKSKAMTLSLESNKLYSIVFKKASYPNKLVIVDTKIPAGLRELVEDPFELQIELAKKSDTLKEDLTDHPVAILTISKKEKSLMASENYYKLTHN
ncbi:MAG: hypothetical protein V4677_12480 [Bacteroidota bacterium]